MKNLTKTLIKAVKVEPIKDDETLSGVCSEGAKATYELDRLTAEQEEKLNAVREEYEPRLAGLREGLKRCTGRLKAWALSNREARFSKRQSLIVAGHRLRFRVSPGKLETTDDLKESDVIDAILASDDEDLIEELITVKPSLNKTAAKRVLLDGDDEKRKRLLNLGLRLAKVENFEFAPAHEDESESEAARKEAVA
ncbi:MAG: host-nuclease inhibitor Gam family protein [Verrucomicrobiota bacterium]